MINLSTGATQASSSKIVCDHADIYSTTTFENSSYSATLKKAIATHELGHVMGLGHTASDDSIMQSTTSITIPKAHDRNDLNNFYK